MTYFMWFLTSVIGLIIVVRYTHDIYQHYTRKQQMTAKDITTRSVWVALHLDFSAIVIFDDELEARRYADKNYMDVHNVPLGEDIRRFILRK